MIRKEAAQVITDSPNQLDKERQDEYYVFPKVEQSWDSGAICTPEAADTAWPIGTNPNSTFTAAQAWFISTYCEQCPVAEACLADALKDDERKNEVRGGLTPKQRLPLQIEYNKFGAVRHETLSTARSKAASGTARVLLIPSAITPARPSNEVPIPTIYDPELLDGLVAISHGYKLREVAAFANVSKNKIVKIQAGIIALAGVSKAITANAQLTIAVKNGITSGLLPITLRLDSTPSLTTRQHTILAALLEGLAPVQISKHLAITETMVGNTTLAIRKKLGAITTPHLVRLVYETGLVPAPITAKLLISEI